MPAKRTSSRKKPLLLPFNFKSYPSLFIGFLVGVGVGANFYPIFDQPWLASSTEKAHVRACFSPEGHCTDKIVTAINAAQSSIFVMAFSFTSPEIAGALVEAHKRGVEVKVLIDKSQLKEKYSQLPFLVKKGIPTFIDSATGIAHNKVILLDKHLTLTGSFNFTRAAESKNAENVLLIDDPSLAQLYQDNWERRVSTAKKIRGKTSSTLLLYPLKK